MSEAVLTLTFPQRVEWGPGAVTRAATVSSLGASGVFVVSDEPGSAAGNPRDVSLDEVRRLLESALEPTRGRA